MRAPLDPARTHAVLRFGFGVTFAFAASELLQWVPTFLAPVLVAVVLTNVPGRPPFKVAFGFIVIVAATALAALFLSGVLRGAPAILFGASALVVFRALYAIARGRQRVAPMLLLICVTTIPVVALESQSVASAFTFSFVRATCFAMVVVWIVHRLWPRVPLLRPANAALPLSRDAAVRSAVIGTAVLVPLMLACLLFGLAHALPVLVATAMIVASVDLHRGRGQALALVIGNIGGGIASLAIFVLLTLHPSIVTLTLLMLLAALAFGSRISVGDPMAAVALVAFNATLIVLSSSLLSDQGTFSIWMSRLMQFVFAGAFAIGMMTLLWPRRSLEART